MDSWNKIHTAKQRYQEIQIPDELDQRVSEAITTARRTTRNRPTKWVMPTVAAACFVFIIGLNTNQAFAMGVYNIPIVGRVAQILTWNKYETENEERILSVTIPTIKNSGYDELENRINEEIRTKINQIVKEAEVRATEYKQAYLETGGNPDDMWKMEINVDYDIFCSNEQYASFLIWKTESLASIYEEQFYYNIDMQTGKELTLSDVLGPNYIEIANNAVENGIQKRLEEDPNAIFFGYGTDESMTMIDGFQTITPDQKFYINSNGNVVIVFDKYEIAPGYMGNVEFELQ